MPSTHSFPPEPLDPELLDELVPLEPLELLDELEELLVSSSSPPSPQNAFRERAQATSEPAQTPSTQAAARYELPLEQPQQEGLQSEYVEQLSPAFFFPTSFSGFEGQPPFTCSALADTFELLELLEPLELLALRGSVGSEPVPGIDEPLPPLQAASSKATAPKVAAGTREDTETRRIVMTRSG